MGKKRQEGGIFSAEGPAPVLHMRSRDVNVTSLIFLCAVKDYRVAQI